MDSLPSSVFSEFEKDLRLLNLVGGFGFYDSQKNKFCSMFICYGKENK